jgi:hypothetical protein
LFILFTLFKKILKGDAFGIYVVWIRKCSAITRSPTRPKTVPDFVSQLQLRRLSWVINQPQNCSLLKRCSLRISQGLEQTQKRAQSSVILEIYSFILFYFLSLRTLLCTRVVENYCHFACEYLSHKGRLIGQKCYRSIC